MKITQTRLKQIIQEELAAVAAEGQGEDPDHVDMDKVGEILKAKFESDVWDLRYNGERRPEEVAADQLRNYVTNHINRLAKKHLKEDELEENFGDMPGTAPLARDLRKQDLNKPLRKPDLKTKSGAGGSGKDRPQHQATHTTRRRGYQE